MDYDYEAHDLLQEAIDDGSIEEGSAAHGVALQSFDRGYDSLTDLQKAVFDRHVVPHLQKIGDQREVQARMRGMPD